MLLLAYDGYMDALAHRCSVEVCLLLKFQIIFIIMSKYFVFRKEKKEVLTLFRVTCISLLFFPWSSSPSLVSFGLRLKLLEGDKVNTF